MTRREGLLPPSVQDHQVGVGFFHRSYSSKDAHGRVTPYPQPGQQQGVGQQLLHPIRRRLLSQTLHDSPRDCGQTFLQGQPFRQAAEHRQRRHAQVGGQQFLGGPLPPPDQAM